MYVVYSDSVKNFKDWYYLATLLTEVAHANICDIELELIFCCSSQVFKFWHHSIFLADVGSYVYNLDDLYQEKTYMKKNLEDFFEGLSFFNNIASSRWC